MGFVRQRLSRGIGAALVKNQRLGAGRKAPINALPTKAEGPIVVCSAVDAGNEAGAKPWHSP